MHLRQKLLTDRQPILPFRCFFVKSWIYFGAQASCLRFCSRQCHHCTVFIIIITINSDRSSWRYDGRYDQCNATNAMHLIHTIKTNKQTMQLLFPENITSDDDNNATSMKSISIQIMFQLPTCVRHFIGCALIECNKCNGEVNIKTLSCFSWLLTWLDSHNKQTKKQRDDAVALPRKQATSDNDNNAKMKSKSKHYHVSAVTLWRAGKKWVSSCCRSI